MQRTETLTGRLAINYIDGYQSQEAYKMAALTLTSPNSSLHDVMMTSLDDNITINHSGSLYSPSNNNAARIFFDKANIEKLREIALTHGFVPLFARTFFDQPGNTFIKYDKKNIPIAVFNFGIKEKEMAIRSLIGIEKDVRELEDDIKPFLYFRGSRNGQLRMVTGFDFYGGAESRNEILDETYQQATDSFYPWMTQSLDSYFDDFLKSPLPVLVLIGLPRTGKSTLVRTLAARRKASLYAAYDEHVFRHKNFIEGYMEIVNQKRLYGNPQAEIMVVEDADNYILARTEGNGSMAKILNTTQGIADATGVKMIFSTNLETLERIDPALLGPGRCFDIMNFGKLTPEQASRVRKDMNLPEIDFTNFEATSFVLGEVINSESMTNGSKLVKPRFGNVIL